MEQMDLDRIRYLELRADGHVVAKVLFHLINLISVGFHDRRQGHKVRPNPGFLVEEPGRNGSLLCEFVHKVNNVRSWSSYQGRRKMLSDPILEIPSDGFKGFRLGDDDEVDGGAGGVEEDGGDQPLEVV